MKKHPQLLYCEMLMPHTVFSYISVSMFSSIRQNDSHFSHDKVLFYYAMFHSNVPQKWNKIFGRQIRCIPIWVPAEEMLSSSQVKWVDVFLSFHSQEMVCMEHQHFLRACNIKNSNEVLSELLGSLSKSLRLALLRLPEVKLSKNESLCMSVIPIQL